MDSRVTPPYRVTSLTWGPPPPCKQALSKYELDLGYVHTNPDIFETAYIYFFTHIPLNRALHHSGERFQKDAFSMSCFSERIHQIH